MKAAGPIRVLVIDDSAQNRRAITEALEGPGDLQVIGRAADGQEGLRLARELRPDVITLDLEMPRLDGFAFLRVLMATVPTPVIVVSSYAHRTDVFKALELGAVDFVAKKGRGTREELEALGKELVEKVRGARAARSTPRKDALPEEHPFPLVVCVAASTGGPPAIQGIVEKLERGQPLTLVVCQHMPPRFTQAFAERLDRLGAFRVKEARDGDPVASGHVYIAPGGRQLELARRAGALTLRVSLPTAKEKHAPSADRLFHSAAAALGPQALAVVLTGMGNDGAEGAAAIFRAGGEVWAEAEQTAVVFGMPAAAIEAGAVKRVLPLEKIAPELLHALKRRLRRGGGSAN